MPSHKNSSAIRIIALVLIATALFFMYRYVAELKNYLHKGETDHPHVDVSYASVDVADLRKSSDSDFDCIEYKIGDLINTPICVHEAKDDRVISGFLKRPQQKVLQKDIVDTFRSLLTQNPDLNFIDIGANLGLWTIVAAAFGRRVLAVEGYPPTASRLQKSLQLGQFESRVTLVTSPLSDKHVNVTFNLVSGNLGGTKVVSVASGIVSQKTFVKKAVTLNDLVPIISDGFGKVFMKMDIEGSELRSLNQSAHFFEAVEIPIIVMEWRFYREKAVTYENLYFETWFKRMGYQACLVMRAKHSKLCVHFLGTMESDNRWGTIGDVFLIKNNFLENNFKKC